MCKLPIKFLFCAVIALMFWDAAQAQPVKLGFRTPQNSLPSEAGSGNIRLQPSAPLPPTELVVPAGTVLLVELSETVSSKDWHAGDTFIAELEHPLVADGWVIARRGQIVTGRVAAAQRAGRIAGVSHLTLELDQVVLVDGHQLSVQSELLENSGPTSRSRDAVGVAVTTAVGAAIGAVCGAKGAAIGAAVGAGTGVAGVLLTRGEDMEIGPEKQLAFRLATPVSISTTGSPHAFWPIAPDDYIQPDDDSQPQPAPAVVVITQPSPQLPQILLAEIQILASGRPGRQECGN